MTVVIDDILRAQNAIAGAVERTPFLHSKTLSDILGAQIYLKFENLQFTSSFKERGALNKLLSLSDVQKDVGVIAMSAGNHAQAVAYHASRLGISATIVMPKFTPNVKIRQTSHFGARVILEGDSLADAGVFARTLADEEGLTFVHPYDDDLIIAGAGTCGLEMINDVPDLDAVVVPVGGGGLISGIATAVKTKRPKIKVYGVESELYPSLTQILRGEEPYGKGTTIAEGIAVKIVGERNIELCRKYVDSVVLVNESQLERAISLLLNIEKSVVEGAGAAGLAAVEARSDLFRAQKVGVVLCGGNIDPRLLASVIMREMVRDGRIARIGVEIADVPGQLARVSSVIADFGCSVIEVQHTRLSLDMSAKHATLDMLIEARDSIQIGDIVSRLRGDGFNVTLLDGRPSPRTP